MTLHERWKEIDQRLRRLDCADYEEESDLLRDAYDQLMAAYQESRALNDEMEILLKENMSDRVGKVL